MKHWSASAALGWLVAAACGGGGGPTAAEGPQLDFSVTAPTRLESKSVIDVEVRLTRAEQVERPITVLIEKANVGEPFFMVARIPLVSASETSATTRVPVLYDPRIRITVSESSALQLALMKTIQVDVLDYP